ncbi:MAG: hypothetical protein WCW52_03815 [Elusimicrobiales bacterium]|jgi:hypothetical protein
MRKKIVIMLVCFGFVPAARAVVNFDQGVDVKSAIENAVVSELKLPEARYHTITDLSRDCKKISFRADDPLTSPETPLHSRESGQDCENYGPPLYQVCHPYYKDYEEAVKVVITAPRTLQPGQKEVFEVCLRGTSLTLKQLSPAYKYSVRLALSSFELTPQGPLSKAAQADREVCVLETDSDYFCTYRCKDGYYFTRSNPHGMVSPGMPFHGCRTSAPRE